MLHLRRFRGILPLLKVAGETELALLTKTREQLLRAGNVKFRFVEGFQVSALGPPLEENASGIVLALAGFDRPVLKDAHEEMSVNYRAKVSLKTETGKAVKLVDFMNEFSSKYCNRLLVLNPQFSNASTEVPPAPTGEAERGYRGSQSSGPAGPRNTKIDILDCKALKGGQFSLEIDCWLNFAFSSIIKLMEEKLGQELAVIDCQRISLGPWTLDKCLPRDVIDSTEPSSLDPFLGSFRQTRVLYRSILEKILTVDAWREFCDARVVTR